MSTQIVQAMPKSLDAARHMINQARAQWPNLWSYGFDVGNKKWSQTGEAPFTALDEEAVVMCWLWLGMQPRTKCVSGRAPGSYVLKHLIERWYGGYVANGCVMVAAHGMGIGVEPDGINARLGIRRLKSDGYIIEVVR